LFAILGPGYSEVSEPEITLLIKNKVFRLDVAVEYLFAVDVVHSGEYAGDEKLGLVFREALDIGEPAPEVSPRQQIHDEVEIVAVVEGAAHVGDEGRGQSLEYLALVEHVVHTLLHHDQRLAHLFHSVQLLGLGQLHLPDFAVAALADDLDEVEVVSGEFAQLLLGGILGDLGEGVVQAGLLLWVVHLYHVG